jgi:hypothetical protein
LYTNFKEEIISASKTDVSEEIAVYKKRFFCKKIRDSK